MKKSILFSLMVIGAVAAMITAATSAVFTDTTTSTGNTFAAGTLQLSLDNNCGQTANNGTETQPRTRGSDTPCSLLTAAFTAPNQNPGDESSHNFKIRNDGSLNGTLKITQTASSSDSGCAAPTSPSWVNGNYQVSVPPADVTVNADTPASDYVAKVKLLTTAANACQGNTLTLDVTFKLDQIATP